MVSELRPGFPNEYSIDEVNAKQVEKFENEELGDIELLPESIRGIIVRLRNIVKEKLALQKEKDAYQTDKDIYEQEGGIDLVDGRFLNEWNRRHNSLMEDELMACNQLDKILKEDQVTHNAYKEYLFRSKRRRNLIRPDVSEN